MALDIDQKHRPDPTADQLEQFLQRLDPDRKLAGEKYEVLRRKLIVYFNAHDCWSPNDLADRAINIVVAKCASQSIQEVNYFSLGVARHVRQEATREARRFEEFRADPPDSSGSSRLGSESILDRLTRQEELNCLRKCAMQLPKPDGNLIIEYYDAGDVSLEARRQKLAETYGLSVEALRTRASRIRKVLLQCWLECMGLPSK
jgi:DNA-directed RNA polymerase specialized sigma24 family protein